MKDEWIKEVLRLSKKKADLYSGCRKIIRGKSVTFQNLWETDDPLTLIDCGYTKAKLAHLTRGYLHRDSLDMAIQLWNIRKNKTSYGSVGFTTYNHLLKNDPTKKSKRASVMGPCIQAVTITQLKGGKKGSYSIDAFYRTTEILKKFPADLVFIRDVLLADFDFGELEFKGLTCHFANITVHPQYFVTAIPYLKDRVFEELGEIKKKDPYFFNWIIKWSARYLCEEHHRGIAKFSQALRVKADADNRIKGRFRRTLIEYLRDNHPGHTRGYEETEGDEE